MQASNYLEDLIANYFFRNQQVTQPRQIYLALYTTNPTDNDSGTEVVGGGYKRVPVTFDTPRQIGERGTIANNHRIDFNKALGDWGEVAYFGLRDSITGGNLLVYGSFNRPTKVEEGTQFIIDAGDLSITIG